MLSINKAADRDHLIIELNGEVDASNSVELDEVIQQALSEDSNKILVDGRKLEYISSAGLGVFMSYLEDFQEKNVSFVIFGLNEKVLNVFHILGLDQLIRIRQTQEEAEQALYEA
ncbi:anti-sigma B factor antagonist [Cyclobacterium xiamenense]|uniref:Anti-sigma factor antagonist n=1 Tax=Cyclobacterium xiamenense TaxID=1297121 RepID=A0A1H6WK17_9BACT|nr:STAS domain-containing protein [Cyclobacterium xiamenense]SEJ17361.1 anti-sigma B factor antagonist [Cyclobacterium xiamenense]